MLWADEGWYLKYKSLTLHQLELQIVPVGPDNFLQVITKNVLINIFRGSIQMLTKGAWVAPSLIVYIVCLINSKSRIHSLGHVHQTLVELDFASYDGLCWKPQCNLFTYVSFPVPLQIRPENIVWLFIS